MTIREDVERFLFDEAALLDDWRLEEWIELLGPEVRYTIPSLGYSDVGGDNALRLISDDRSNLISRARQLMGNKIWAEIPRSRTRRLITNTRILEDNDDSLTVEANFAIWKFQNDKSSVFVGKYHHVLSKNGGQFQFHDRMAVLDMNTLHDQQMISIII